MTIKPGIIETPIDLRCLLEGRTVREITSVTRSGDKPGFLALRLVLDDSTVVHLGATQIDGSSFIEAEKGR